MNPLNHEFDFGCLVLNGSFPTSLPHHVTSPYPKVPGVQGYLITLIMPIHKPYFSARILCLQNYFSLKTHTCHNLLLPFKVIINFFTDDLCLQKQHHQSRAFCWKRVLKLLFAFEDGSASVPKEDIPPCTSLWLASFRLSILLGFLFHVLFCLLEDGARSDL